MIKHMRGKGRWRGTFHIQTIISINIYDSVFMLVLSVFSVLHGPVVSSLTSVCGHEHVRVFIFFTNLCNDACSVLLRAICIHAEQGVCYMKSHDQKVRHGCLDLEPGAVEARVRSSAEVY